MAPNYMLSVQVGYGALNCQYGSIGTALVSKASTPGKIRHTGSSPVTGVIAYWDKRLVHRALTPEVAVRSRNRPFLPWWLNWYSSRLLICHLGVISGFGVQVPATALKHLNKFSDLSLQQIGKICCNFFVYFIDKCVHMCFNDIKHRQS